LIAGSPTWRRLGAAGQSVHVIQEAVATIMAHRYSANRHTEPADIETSMTA
jgi:hypothetical protein